MTQRSASTRESKATATVFRWLFVIMKQQHFLQNVSHLNPPRKNRDNMPFSPLEYNISVIKREQRVK